MNVADINDFDWDQYLDNDNVENNNVRIGFSQRSLIYTYLTAHIAINQDVESKNYRFCCYTGKSEFYDHKDTYFPIAIVILPNTEIAEAIIPLRCISVYENSSAIKNEGVEVVFFFFLGLYPTFTSFLSFYVATELFIIIFVFKI